MADPRICSIPDCGKHVKTRGWCSAHYERYRVHGDPLGLGYSPKRKTHRNLSVTVTCKECGTDFHPWQGREETSRWCSSRCHSPERTRAVSNTSADFFKKFKKAASGCWEWNSSMSSTGYGIFTVDAKHVKAHRYSYEMHKGRIPPGLYVCHSCDNRRCVNPAHLWLGSCADNMRDMVVKGRNCTKLTADKARAIRSDPRVSTAVAADYGVSQQTVWNIRAHRTWRRA